MCVKAVFLNDKSESDKCLQSKKDGEPILEFDEYHISAAIPQYDNRLTAANDEINELFGKNSRNKKKQMIHNNDDISAVEIR